MMRLQTLNIIEELQHLTLDDFALQFQVAEKVGDDGVLVDSLGVVEASGGSGEPAGEAGDEEFGVVLAMVDERRALRSASALGMVMTTSVLIILAGDSVAGV